MTLKSLADDAVRRINAAISTQLSDAERITVSRIVEQALIDAVNDVTQRYRDTTKSYFGEDADKAHKLAEEIKRAKAALISNLDGLR
ncbi:MAG: hypothetical protein C0606_05130 [Hyphomicrobiales bacterium]|nr:MAG: hypothetical protein C0606_05130 [Hyphomicrobiales bacterium]